MVLISILAGFVLGYGLQCVIESSSCKHDYVHEDTTSYRNPMSEKIEFKIKHYECTKCHYVKNVRIG